MFSIVNLNTSRFLYKTKMSKKTYFLSDRPQLIDLNGNHVNFIVEFQVQAKDPTKTFQTIVLTQEQLDTTDLEKMEMKQAKGQIGGTITANNNKYQNYFLILRNSLDGEPVEVEVNLNIQSPPPIITQSSTEGYSKESNNPSVSSSTQEASDNVNVIPLYKKPWFWIFIGLLLLFGGLYYYFYIYKTTEKITPVNETGIETSTSPVTSLSEEAKLYNRVSNLKIDAK